MPKYPGGTDSLLSFISSNVNYPKQAEIDKIEGKVYVSFIVEKDGSTTNFLIIRSVTNELDEEALRVVKLMDKWIPGKQKGKNVRVRLVMPIQFKIQ